MIYFIPTPIGNLGDISQRSLEILCEIDVFFCEDTRNTKKLLHLLQEKYTLAYKNATFISLHSHNEKEKLKTIDKEIFAQNCAYLSDAGMPCISDPGAMLIEFAKKENIKYDVLPGANALMLCAVASGFSENEFSFFGFLPNKGNLRQIALEKVLNHQLNSIIYESPKRIINLLENIIKIDEKRQIFILKEATKIHQTYFSGNVKEVLQSLKDNNIQIKGEYSIMIKANKDILNSNITQEDILNLNLPPKQKSKLLAKISSQNVAYWYEKLTKYDKK